MTTLTIEAPALALICLARDPDGSSLTVDQIAHIDQLVRSAADGAGFRSFEQSRYCLSLKEGNAVAAIILEAHGEGADTDEALIESCLLPRGDAWHCACDLAREIVHRYDGDLQGITRAEYSNLVTALVDRLEPLLIEADTSTPRDALSNNDRAEVVFVLSAPGKHHLDASIVSQKPWPQFGELCLNEDLAHAFACLGYTIGDYRKASGNWRPADLQRGQARLRRPAVARPAAPLCSWAAIEEMVDNACATHFLFCLYAMVPIAQLLDIDPAGPVTFSKAAIATWNPWDGTFHDAVTVPMVTVSPKMGTLMSPARWHSPDSICGFVHRYYQAEITPPHSAQ